MNRFGVRQALEDDLEEIARIETENFSEPWSETSLRDTLHLTDRARIFVAEDEKCHIVGHLVFYYSDFDGELETIAVDQGWRGHGIGRQLMDAMLRLGGELGLEQIVLEVRKSNAGAIALYESGGFVICGERKNFYRFPREDALVMTCPYPKEPDNSGERNCK